MVEDFQLSILQVSRLSPWFGYNLRLGARMLPKVQVVSIASFTCMCIIPDWGTKHPSFFKTLCSSRFIRKLHVLFRCRAMVSTDDDPAATTTSMLEPTPTPTPTSTTRRRNVDEHEHIHHDEPANGQYITYHHNSISKALETKNGPNAPLQKENVNHPLPPLKYLSFSDLIRP